MRILVGTDGSDPAAIGIEAARDLAAQSHAELRIVAVVPPTGELFGTAWPADMIVDPEPIERAACQQLEEYLRDQVGRTPAEISTSSILRRGRPATEIVAEAVGWRADLIVVGSRGHGALGSILLGSVSEEVIDRSPVPVLVARTPRLRRLILAVDGSPAAESATDFLIRDGSFSGFDVSVLHVAPPDWPWWLGAGSVGPASVGAVLENNAAIRSRQAAAVERATRILSTSGLNARSGARVGDAADELVRAATELDADTIVIGSRGQTGLTRLVLGSVARHVVRHAPASVLVVHAPAAVAALHPDASAPARLGDEPAHAAALTKEHPMKILLAYDGGEPAKRALKTAADIATAMHAGVDVVSVIPIHPGRVPVDPWDDRPVHDQELREAHAELANRGITTRLVEPAGDPARAIETVAREGAYDMIVLGSRRQGVLGRVLQGSVSEHVATHADATVVIAR